MAYAYIYLALIPTMIAIAILISNKNAQKKYDTKKAMKNLYTQLITMGVLFSWFIISRCHILSKISSNQWPFSFFLFMFGIGVLAPMLALNRSKLNRKKDILDKKWFIILCLIILTIFVIFMPGILMTLKFKS